MYNYTSFICPQCNKPASKRTQHYNENLKKGHKSYCSQKCARIGTQNGKMIECATCQKLIYRTKEQQSSSKSGKVFCTKSCATVFNNTLKIEEKHGQYTYGISTYRKRALEHYGCVCTVPGCGYDTKAILEVHHRDHNRANNLIENLDVLCPTHHNEYHFGVRHYETRPKPQQSLA